MVYFSVRLFIGNKNGLIARNSKNLLGYWDEAAFCEDYKIAQKIAERACETARAIHPRAKISYIIQADESIPARAEIVRG